MERRRYHGHGDPGVMPLLEPRKKRGEPLLLFHRGTPRPILGALSHHLPGVLREQPAVVSEVEPSALPSPVRRGHGAPDVLVGSRLAELQRATADPQGNLLPSLVAGGHICLEKVKPEVPVGRNPQEPLAHRGKDGRLHHRVGVEVVQLHLIIMQDRPDKTADRSSEPPVQEQQEANHIAWRRVWLPVVHRGSDPLWQPDIRDGAEDPSLHARVQRGPGHVARGPRVVSGHGYERSRVLAGRSGEDGDKEKRRQGLFCARAGGKKPMPPRLLL